MLSLKERRFAGARRIRTAAELIDYFASLDPLEREKFLRVAGQPPIAGGAQVYNQVTSNVSLTTAQATLVSLLGGGQAPLNLAIGFVAQVTGVAAGASVTCNIVRNDTSAVIGAAVITNNGAGSGNVGGVDPIAIVPAAVPPGSGILMQAAVSSSTGTAVGSATQPITLCQIGIA